MKLFSAIGPYPRIARIFIAEKGLDIAVEAIDSQAAENRRAPYLAKNPAGELPCLELDDGSYLAEAMVICEYLDELHPEPPLIGTTARERAETRMWTRRVDLHVVRPLSTGLSYGEYIDFFRDRIHTIPHAANDLVELANEGLVWLDGLMTGRDYIAGDRFTLADVVLYAFVDLATSIGRPLDPALEQLGGWYRRISARPSIRIAAP